MRCPFCAFTDTVVKDSRPGEDHTTIRRRRFCPSCSSRFTTLERAHLRDLMVIKKEGRLEAFDQEKLVRSLRLALHKRPIDHERIERVVTALIRQLETSGEAEIPTSLIGEKVMEALSGLDSVGYVRYASIYRNFREVKDFEEFIGEIQEEEPDAAVPSRL
ncbi:MAG: transcriptional regulator NrdR [Alphaproteobacteria bacterium]